MQKSKLFEEVLRSTNRKCSWNNQFAQKRIEPWTIEALESYNIQKFASNRLLYKGADHSICNLKYVISCEIKVIADNRSSYDFHLLIKHLTEKFNSSGFYRLGQNSEQYISFSASMDKSG